MTGNGPRPTCRCERCGTDIPLDGVTESDVVACPKCAHPNVPVPRCDEDQLAMLRRCSEAKDVTEWKEWRKANPDEEIWLQRAGLNHAYLEGAELYRAHLEGGKLSHAHLEGADFRQAHLEGARLSEARLEGAYLAAHLEGAYLFAAHVEGAKLYGAHLEGADLNWARLEGTDLSEAHLEGGELSHAHLEGVTFRCAALEGVVLSFAVVDGGTLFQYCTVDRETDFTGVGLGACRVDPGLKQTLEYSIRRKRWQEWYADGPKWRWPFRQLVRPFWWMSDYGRSTGRIALLFLILSLAFAGVYYACDLLCDNGLVHDLSNVDGTPIAAWLVPVRAAYFSIVTMTTLGFGDMHANPHSLAGHLLLAFQVILGYVLLGALVCRLAILFQAGGPAAKFAKPWKPKPEAPQEADE